MFKTIFVLLSVIFCTLLKAPAVHAKIDGQEGHGGDIAVSIFIGIAYKTYLCLENSPEILADYPLLLEDFKSAMQRASVFSVERTLLNGNEVDAINYPTVDSPKILISRNRWLDERLSADMRALLVFHEYLSVAGYDDSSYKISYIQIQRHKTCINKE
jgi:hypothetical protein